MAGVVYILHRRKRHKNLAGVLYFHRISNFRMGGTVVKNINMFRKLCGDAALSNAVVVTNVQGEVDPCVVGEREAELMSNDAFFKQVIEGGARMARHEGTVTSAEGIIRPLLNNHPLPLLIQIELVNRGKNLLLSSAGRELNRKLGVQVRKYEEEMQDLREELEEVIRDGNELMERLLKEQRENLVGEINWCKEETEKLAFDFNKEWERIETKLRDPWKR